jgi:hypothetical protein
VGKLPIIPLLPRDTGFRLEEVEHLIEMLERVIGADYKGDYVEEVRRAQNKRADESRDQGSGTGPSRGQVCRQGRGLSQRSFVPSQTTIETTIRKGAERKRRKKCAPNGYL